MKYYFQLLFYYKPYTLSECPVKSHCTILIRYFTTSQFITVVPISKIIKNKLKKNKKFVSFNASLLGICVNGGS